MPKLGTNISKCQTKKDDFERRNWETMMALKAKTENVALNAETKNVALNAELKRWLWMPKLRSDDDFECRTENAKR